jgi:hypothetical protein
MSSAFKCNECSNISHSVTDEAFHSCPYCGFYVDGTTLIATTAQTENKQEKTAQWLEGALSRRSTFRTPPDLAHAVHVRSVSSSSALHTTTQGKRRTNRW